MSLYVLIGATAASLALGVWGGIEWQRGQHALALKQAQKELRDQSHAADSRAIRFAEDLAQINTTLGDTRARLRSFTTGRACLSADAVRLLNSPTGVPAAASQPASAPGGAASDQDVADALAICRAEHGKLSTQLNSILDIEDSRQ